MQALTSFNVISFFEDFTTASYIRDERVCASDKDKGEEEEEKNPRVCRSRGETLGSFTAIFTTLSAGARFVLVLLSRNICNAPLEW